MRHKIGDILYRYFEDCEHVGGLEQGVIQLTLSLSFDKIKIVGIDELKNKYYVTYNNDDGELIALSEAELEGYYCNEADASKYLSYTKRIDNPQRLLDIHSLCGFGKDLWVSRDYWYDDFLSIKYATINSINYNNCSITLSDGAIISFDDIKELRPVLRSLDLLNTEITVNGYNNNEAFIPIEEINKNYGFLLPLYNFDYSSYLNILKDDNIAMFTDVINLLKLWKFNYAHFHHIDYKESNELLSYNERCENAFQRT